MSTIQMLRNNKPFRDKFDLDRVPASGEVIWIDDDFYEVGKVYHGASKKAHGYVDVAPVPRPERFEAEP